MEALDGDVNIEDFREFSRTHPALLFNAFQMQEAIQERVLGRTFWEYYSERRIEVSKGRLYVPVTEFIELHINKKMMEAVKNKSKCIQIYMYMCVWSRYLCMCVRTSHTH